MGVSGHKPVGDRPVETVLPQAKPDDYRVALADDRVNNLRGMMAYIDGAPWTVDLYNQILDKHNDLKAFDPSQQVPYQTYSLIHDLEIRVTQALDSQIDSGTQNATITGRANVASFVRVNKEDVFVASASGTGLAIFRITKVQRKTHNVNSVFEIEYVLLYMVKQHPEYYDVLKMKTTQEFYFVKDRLMDNGQPILKSSDFFDMRQLGIEYDNLCEDYYRKFWNRNYKTLVLPGQERTVYDHYLVEFISAIVEVNQSHESRFVRRLFQGQDNILHQPQFWEMVMKRDLGMLPFINKKMGMISRLSASNNSYIGSIRHQNIDYHVYPADPDQAPTVACMDAMPIIVVFTELLGTAVFKNNTEGDLTTTAWNTYDHHEGLRPLIPYVAADDFYVLSQNFYDQTENMTVLEIMVKDYINGVSLNMPMLKALVASYRQWPVLEKFYYGPLLMVMLKEAALNVYT